MNKQEMQEFVKNFLTEERREKFKELMKDARHANFQEVAEAFDVETLYKIARDIYDGHTKAKENGVQFSELEEEKTENYLIHTVIALEKKLKNYKGAFHYRSKLLQND
ncbi:MAG: hypothetical protein IJ542_00670 [Clostridia bacterium]|nr:hypothetical protein [Clostridia bacterium]